MKISLCIIATRNYTKLVKPLIESVNKYFLPEHDITIHLFCDKENVEYDNTERVSVIEYQIPSYGFPAATLYRYAILTELDPKHYATYLFYIDVDMLLVNTVGNEILGDIVAIRHPGYFNGGWGS